MNCSCPYCTAPFDHDVWGPDDEIEKLQEENHNLRQALQWIRDCNWQGQHAELLTHWEMRHIAREALE